MSHNSKHLSSKDHVDERMFLSQRLTTRKTHLDYINLHCSLDVKPYPAGPVPSKRFIVQQQFHINFKTAQLGQDHTPIMRTEC